MSLKGAALDWLNSTPSALLSTWSDVEREFLSVFFPRHLTAKMRSQILDFRQKEGENFYQAWERYQGLITDCPHHGFKRNNILGTFYNGCNYGYRRMIDSSSRGSFFDLNVQEGESLLNRMAKNERDNQWLDQPSETADGMTNLRDITNRLRQRETYPRDVYYCGTGNPHDDGSGKILRDMERDEDMKMDRKRQRDHPTFYPTHEPTDTRSSPGDYSIKQKLNEVRELRGMIEGLFESEIIRSRHVDEQLDRLRDQINTKTGKLARGYEICSARCDATTAELAKEYALVTKQEEDALAREYCQFVEAERLKMRSARMMTQASKEPNRADPETPPKPKPNLGNPVLKDTGAGFKLITRSCLVKPQETPKSPPERDFREMARTACAMMSEAVKAMEELGQKPFEPGDNNELKD